jgi:Uma2 family endonuclease
LRGTRGCGKLAFVASVLEPVDMMEIEDQTAFNLAVWEKVLENAELAALPYRIETDRNGQLIMSPPPASDHGEDQARIVALLARLLPGGIVIAECPISTSDGVKLADVAWISRERRGPQRRSVCLTRAPEICVEVISPRNTRREMREKRALYFDAGAEEVWFCRRDGQLEFFLAAAPETPAVSRLCPDFPRQVAVD